MQGVAEHRARLCAGEWLVQGAELHAGCGCVQGAGLFAGGGASRRVGGAEYRELAGLTSTAQEPTWDPSHFLKHGKVSQAVASPASRRQPSRAPPPRFPVGSAGSRITGLQSRRGG
jgi:hypothetical protein